LEVIGEVTWSDWGGRHDGIADALNPVLAISASATGKSSQPDFRFP